MVVVNNEINNNKKCRHIAGNLDGHADAAVQYGTHRLMKHIPGLTRSHLIPPSSKCLHCIVLAATKVIDFGCKHKSLTKHNVYLAIIR
jgi:hypothetical protein